MNDEEQTINDSITAPEEKEFGSCCKYQPESGTDKDEERKEQGSSQAALGF